ncbi:hypothetical protein BCR39DRAFT_543634 [Naematelia encephala]|uniref:HECT-type E3 ubiquitin transferase n=1 Tax=Naematelia encephala TaxID=71784 RepID=A0A1Y2ASX9_9TREE|nr:hypothetical protein BCR39DRAFT_543634 [Naematelia encephala]
MNEDDDQWMDEGDSAGEVRISTDDHHNDDNMSGSDDEDDDNSGDDDMGGDAGGRAGGFDQLARLAGRSGLNLDDATAAALFGGSFRVFGGMMSSLSNRLKGLKADLRSPSPTKRLAALRECSELLLVSNEDTLGGTFSTNAFATEFIAILKGQPNIDDKQDEEPAPPAEMDEDAQLAAALALSTGGAAPTGMPGEEEMESQLVACRCLAHLMEALPGTGHTLVHLGAVPVLCSKLTEISYIELAEQTLSTMEKISAEYPAAIVRENGLEALLNFLPFFSTNVQRTAVTAAANCCRNISADHYDRIKNVFPILRDVLTQGDQRLVEQATLAVVRTIESYRHNAHHLEGLLDVPTVVAINALLMPSGGSPLLTPSTYTHLLKALTSSARGSAKVTVAFLEAGMSNTLYQILTGVLPSSHGGDEQGAAEGGQGLAGGVADMAVLQNLAHRPKDQVEEALALICELLPPPPKDGVFDPKAYTEKSLAKVRKGRPADRSSTRRSSRTAGESSASAGPSTPKAGEGVSLPSETTPTSSAAAATREAVLKAKREAEQAIEQRLELLQGHAPLVGRFINAIVPVLVDVYAASVALRVRTKVLTGLVKAVAFAGEEDLRSTLKSVPMASFLCAIISSKDNPLFVLYALQLVELLTIKLPDVYHTSFLREGVVFEIEALGKQELSTAKVAADEAKGSADSEGPETSNPTSRTLDIPEDIRAMFPPGSIPSSLSAFLADTTGVSTPRKQTQVDPNDINILRARMLAAKKIFDASDDSASAATMVLDSLSASVTKLCAPESSEAELRDTLRDIAGQFSANGQALSSFELLKSGLVDGLLEFVDIDGSVSSADRRTMLYEVFSDHSISSPPPLTLLVKRLHESLGRLENFEVETAFGGVADAGRPSSSSLSRTMRIRLQAEEGQDIPKQVSSLSITIQAIAPMQALHDYLRPRVADSNYMSGSRLANMFAAYAGGVPIPLGGAGSNSSRILSALTGRAGEGNEEPATASSAPESSRQPVPDPTPGEAAVATPQPVRRRSARLSGQATQPDSLLTANPDPPAPLASSAPEPSIFTTMPLGMDFDDDGYSDDEYGHEVFEDEMEDELARPAEKVVNMSVAPDGSRVEAKTPEGTRIATPSQAGVAANQAGPSGSGTTTPRTASYAGAVKAAPVDWHLEFSFNGNSVSLDDTIYGAVHKHQQAGGPSSFGGVYGTPVVIKFSKVDGPAPTKAPLDAPSPASVASGLPTSFESSASTSKILRLLRVIHGLCVEAREVFGAHSTVVDENLFVNNKLTAKLTRQLEETMIIASNCMPEWAVELPKHFSFLFPFETRYSFLQSTSFGYGRLIAKYATSQQGRNSHRRDDLSHLARIVRQKVRISRSQLLESAAKVLELYGTSSGILEVEYFDEIGTGLGPTLEFYSLVSKEFARRSLHLWRDEDEGKPGSYVHHPKGLYPAPLPPTGQLPLASGSNVSWYKSLGLFMGRALLDSRIIDVNLNRVFLKLILGQKVKKNIATLKLVDESLARSLERLQGYLYARKEIEALHLPAASRRSKLIALTISGAKLQDLSLDFTLPGYNIELKPGGAHIEVDDSNLEEYLGLVLEMILGSGVAQQVKAFQDGFSMIFSVEDLKIFSPEELGLLFGNADEDWSKEALEQAIKADHGYNLDSRAVQNLVEVMSSYNKDQRRQFLQFITGAPKLPIGGFRGLNPPFTVVRKPHEAPFRADDYLPSVMTCAQYLKMPDYSTKEVLAAQLKRAIQDGGGSFHLS